MRFFKATKITLLLTMQVIFPEIGSGEEITFSEFGEYDAKALCADAIGQKNIDQQQWLVENISTSLVKELNSFKMVRPAEKLVSVIDFKSTKSGQFSLELSDQEQWYCINAEAHESTKLTVKLGCGSKVLFIGGKHQSKNQITISGGSPCTAADDQNEWQALARNQVR